MMHHRNRLDRKRFYRKCLELKRVKTGMRALVVFLILALFLTPVVGAANDVLATLFSAKLRFNGENKSPGQGQHVLNYNNRVYVPLRFIAESMGADVFYDEKSRTVSVKHVTPHPTKSQVVAVDSDRPFTLALRSAKRHYFQEESLRVWASFTYSGDKEMTISHTTPLIGFEIRDENGRTVRSERFNEGRSTFNKHDEYRYEFPVQLIRSFHTEHDISSSETPMLHDLPQGKYILAAEARYSLPDRPQEEKVLRAEIEIQIH